MRRPVARNLTVLAVSAAVVVSVGASAPPAAQTTGGEKKPLAVGYGGAVSSVDPDASAAGIEVLRKGGKRRRRGRRHSRRARRHRALLRRHRRGGYFVYYDAKSRTVRTIDGARPPRCPPTRTCSPRTASPSRSPPPSAAA
ncbi:hypothetical protein GCM10011428_34200 [Streptomyces violaceus]